MTYTHKRIVAKVYGFLYIKVLVEFEANLSAKEQISRVFPKKEELETFEIYMHINSTWLTR